MNIIIAGDGKVGAALTKQLAQEGHDITIIDNNQHVLDASIERYDVSALHGNCASMDVLREADVAHTDLLIAATSADEINLLCCITAHMLNPRLHTIARVRNPEYTEQIFHMRDIFGLSLAVNPEKQAAREIERLLQYPGTLKRDTFAKGRVEIVEIRVEAGSCLENVVLHKINDAVHTKVLVCSVLRNGRAITPDGNFVLKTGDRVFFTAPTENLVKLLSSLGIVQGRLKNVILCGGGRLSFYLAQRLLLLGTHVEIIESDRARCDELAELLPQATIVHGDASDTALLDEEGVAGVDAVVSMTGMDELNIIISLYCKSAGVKQVVTKLGHISNQLLLEHLPLDSIVSPKETCCSNIVRYVRALENQVGAAVAMHSISDGHAEALEFRVDETTRNCGKPLKDIKLKKGVLMACITRAAAIEIPSGNSSYMAGDTIILVSDKSTPINTLNDIFA